MPFATYQSRRIHYQDTGYGPCLLLLHGFCEDLSIWNDLAGALAGFRVVCIDLPGFGQTALTEQANIEAMAEDVKRVVEQLKIDSFVLLGHSMGGYVSLAYAERYASDLRGLGLIHSFAQSDSAAKKESRNKGIQFVEKHGSVAFATSLLNTLFPKNYRYPATIQQLIKKAGDIPPASIIHSLEAMRDRPDRSAVLQTTGCPVLFVIGALDEVVPLGASLEATHEPTVADIHILEEVAHMAMFEAPASLLSIVQQFVQYCYQTFSHR